VTSVLNTVVQGAVNLTTAATRLIPPSSGDRPKKSLPDKERKSGQKRVDSRAPLKEKKTFSSLFKDVPEKGAKVKQIAKTLPANETSVPDDKITTKSSRRREVKKQQKLAKRLELPLDFGQDLNKDRFLTPEQRTAMMEARLSGGKKVVPKDLTSPEGRIKAVSVQKQSKIPDVKTRSANLLFSKVKRSYNSPMWSQLCSLIKVGLGDLERKCSSFTESELAEINRLRASGVPPILAIGYFQPEVVSTLDWSSQVDLKDQLDKACKAYTRVKANSEAKKESVNKSLLTYLSHVTGKEVPYCDFTMEPDLVSPSAIREELSRNLKMYYRSPFDKLFVNVHRSPIRKFSIVSYRIDIRVKRESLDLRFSDLLFARWSTTKGALHFLIASDLDTLRRVSTPKKPVSSSLLSAFPEKALIGLFPPISKVYKSKSSSLALDREITKEASSGETSKKSDSAANKGRTSSKSPTPI